jgi:nitrate/nitrite transporter NarK
MLYSQQNLLAKIIVTQNQSVAKKLLTERVTTIHFDTKNMWVLFNIDLCLSGISWGIGKAAVYKHPDYFPTGVGVVGGMVGLLGGLTILLPHHLQLPANLHGRMVKLMDICTTPFGPLFWYGCISQSLK